MNASEVALARAGALRHARVRWVGAPLLFSGAMQVLWSLVLVAVGGPWWTFFLAMFGTGLALASFGANHDTAMALALRIRRGHEAGEGRRLPEALGKELDEELERDRAGTLSLKASPRIALALPVLALVVQAFSAWRLVGA